MTVAELIKRLQQFDGNKEVMILDGSNGSGVPRALNLGPRDQVVTQANEDDTDDCDGMVGQVVVGIGLGLTRGKNMSDIAQIAAQKKLARMRRYGSHRVKVAVRRHGSVAPVQALALVKAQGIGANSK